MREILFRGKRIDNEEWAYGRLLADDVIVQNGQSFDVEANKIFGCDLTVYAVDPDTVGQYTGLKDCKGNRIFEGDILKDKHGVYSISYDENGEGFRWKDSEGCDSLCIEITHVSEVIGNVFDNPELLNP